MQCTCPTIRPREIGHREGEPFHDPHEGGCGHAIPFDRAARIEAAGQAQRAPDPATKRADESSPNHRPAPSGTAFRIQAQRTPSGGLEVTLGNSTATTPDELWQILSENLGKASNRARARADRLAAERAADLANIDRAIANGQRSTGPATRRDTAPAKRKRKPKAQPDLSLDDLGL